MAEKVLKIAGMSCGHCTAAVEKAAKTVAGVQTVVVDLQAGKLTMQYDGNTQTVDQVIAAIEDVGFEASVL